MATEARPTECVLVAVYSAQQGAYWHDVDRYRGEVSGVGRPLEPSGLLSVIRHYSEKPLQTVKCCLIVAMTM